MIDNYNKLPLGKYLELCAIDPALPDIDRQVQMVSILSDIPEDDLYNLPVPEYSALAAKTAFLGDELPQPQERVMKEYRLGSLTLLPVTDIRKMTTAQFIDFQTFVQQEGRDVELLATFLVPKGHKYNDDYDIMDVQAAVRDNLSVILAQDLRAFFFAKCRTYALAILTFSGWQARKIKDRETRKAMQDQIAEAKTSLQHVGDGSEILMRYPRPADAAGMRSGIWP